MSDPEKNSADPEDNGSETPDKATNDNPSTGLYKPKDLPEHLLGKTDQETIDLVSKAYAGARTELSKKNPNIPEKAEDYKIEVPEEISSVLFKPGDDGKDPVFEGMKNVFHAAKIVPEQALMIMAGMKDIIANMNEEGSGHESAADIQFTKMGGIDKAQPEIESARTFISGLKNSEKLSEAAAGELELLTYHSEGLSALREIRTLLGDKQLPAKLEGQGAGDGKITQKMLNERVADKRYRPGPDFDKGFYDETTRMFEKLYPEEKN